MEALVPTGTVTMTPRELGALPGHADAVVILRAQGISTEHSLTLDYYADGGPRLIYCVGPEGGPYEGIQRWADTPREFPTWTLPAYGVGPRATSMQIQAGACQYVLDAACDEVAAESDLGEGWRTA